MFLENTIKKCTRKPIYSEDETVPVSYEPPIEVFRPKMINWNTFKTLIYEIYDHRIQHGTEINGVLNTSYMTLDEHLLIFMLEKHKSRPATEKAIIQFLASLKYYSETW